MNLFRSINCNQDLILNLIKREISGRYRGSMIGMFWMFFNPLLMLMVYTFVFSVVFKARWGEGSESKTEFALVLFTGLIVFNLFSECINKSPTLIIGHSNYVKKVIFPLEILSVVILGSAVFHFFISFLVWLIFYLIFFGLPPITIFYLPIILIPILFLCLGLSWFLASTGVYLRDIAQVTSVFTTVMMFLTPIFYPITALPERFQFWIRLNPVTFVVDQTRASLIWGYGLNWLEWTIYTILCLLISLLGFVWFQKTRKGFADVI